MNLTGRINEQRTKRLQRGNTVMPCLALSYSLGWEPGNTAEWPTSQKDGMTVEIDANGGGGSHFRLTLTDQRVDESGDATTDSTYIFDGSAAGSGTVTAVCATLYDLVKAINDNVPSVTAWALNAPHSLSLAADTFQDLSSTYIPSNGIQHLSVLYRTVASGGAGYMRVGIPEERDNGYIRAVSLRGFCTGATNGTVRIYRDAYSDNIDDGDEVVLHQSTLAEAETEYLDKDKTDAYDYQGPLIIEVDSDDLSAYDYVFGYMQGSL